MTLNRKLKADPVPVGSQRWWELAYPGSARFLPPSLSLYLSPHFQPGWEGRLGENGSMYTDG